MVYESVVILQYSKTARCTTLLIMTNTNNIDRHRLCRLKECLSGIDEEHSSTLHKASKCDHYMGELESIHENHKKELKNIMDQKEEESNKIQSDLESVKIENKNLEATLTKTSDELNFYKNENLDSMMKKEITIINQAAELEKITQKNKEILEKYDISESLRKSQKENIEELKKKILTIEAQIIETAGNTNSQLLIAQGQNKENEGLQNHILELENSLLSNKSEIEEYVKDIQRLNEAAAESLKITIILNTDIEERTLKITELEDKIVYLETSNKELREGDLKQQHFLSLSDSRIEEIEEEMRDLVKSLVALEVAKEEERIEFESHIEKLVNEMQERETAVSALKDESSALQSELQIERIKSLNLENKIASVDTHNFTAPGTRESEGKDSGSDIIHRSAEHSAVQQALEQSTAEGGLKYSLLEEIEGLKMSKKELEEQLAELETQLSTVVVTALSNEAAAKTEIETHLYEAFRLASEVQGLQIVVEQQTEEIVYLQSQSTGGSPRASFTSRHSAMDDIVEEVERDFNVEDELAVSDDVFAEIDMEGAFVGKDGDDMIRDQTGGHTDRSESEGMGEPERGLENAGSEIQRLRDEIQGLTDRAQEMDQVLADRREDLVSATAALEASEAETSALIQAAESKRLEYLEKDDLISQVVEGKKTLEEEIKRFLGE